MTTTAPIAIPEVIAECRDYNDFIEAFRKRKAELGLSDAALEQIAGLTSGHVSKILPASRSKLIGPMVLTLMMGALGIKFLVVEDPEAIAKIRRRLTPRAESRVRGPAHDKHAPL